MMGMEFIRKLTIPKEVKEMYPLTQNMRDVVDAKTQELKDVFAGKNDKLILIIGPCSADNEDSVLDYVSRLVYVQEKVKDKIIIVPRIYTNKPRTTGAGYKGMLHQPDPNEKPDVFKGILATRHIHMRTIEETGFAWADEMLYPENYRYLDDLLAYVAVGARSVENQQHRLTASGTNCPVGMKNPTSGVYSVMLNAIMAAQSPHNFIFRGWEVMSEGNPYAHAILRGYASKHGGSHPNYHFEDIITLAEMYEDQGLANPAIVIDTNHANSGKNPYEQPRIIKDVLHSARNNETVAKLIKGFMIESYIEDGSQPVGGGCYGKSITDPCLGWEKSERLIYEVADLL